MQLKLVGWTPLLFEVRSWLLSELRSTFFMLLPLGKLPPEEAG